MERDVISLFQSAMSAAEDAAKDGGSNESRCIDLLKSLKDFPVTVDVLAETQIDKRIRHLKKHQRQKIRLMAVWLMEKWSNMIKAHRHSSKETPKAVSHNDFQIYQDQSKSNEDQSSGKKRKRETGVMFPAIKRVWDSRRVLLDEDEKVFSCFKKPVQELPRVSKGSDTTPFKCPDASRNKVREILLEAFRRVAGEASDNERVRGCDPVCGAVAVESVMFKNLGPYNGPKKLKYRSIIFNVKDPKNPDLRREILLGDIKPERLVNMNSEEMASDYRQCENALIKRNSFFGIVYEDSEAKSDDDESISIESLW